MLLLCTIDKVQQKLFQNSRKFLELLQRQKNSGVGGENHNINYSIKNSKYFDYKRSITGKLEGINTKKEKVKIAVSLKHLRNFWRTL